MDDSAAMARMTVDEVIDLIPDVIPSFARRRMHCVGCPMARFETLAEVCEIYAVALEPFLADLISQAGTDMTPFMDAN